jgi:Asp/Glu/hydantoin racemase
MGVLALLLGAGVTQAATLDQDEARIEALIRAEQAAAKTTPAVATTDATVLASAVAPAPVVAQAIAPSPDQLTNDDWLAPPATPDSRLRFEDIAQHVGRKVAVVTVSDRVHKGVVTAVDKRGLTLLVPHHGAGGGATYTLRREQIARIDAL